MNKAILLIFLAALCAISSNAQVIKSVESTPEDYIRLLQDKGYESYSFDLSGLSDKRYKLRFIVQEYVGTEKVSDNVLDYNPPFVNMRMLTDFDEEGRKDIKPEDLDDPDRGIFRLSKRLSVGIMPTDNDTTKRIVLNLNRMGTLYGILDLRPVTNPKSGKTIHSYSTRPFKDVDLKGEGGFVPLVLLGSVWYDERYDVFRFCGENELERDLTSKMIGEIPYFYVIGVQIEPASDK